MRKHLLEYDEVMDEQRKQVYKYRQRILDGGNCRQLILDMIDKQIRLMVPKLLDPNYRWETIAGWASHAMGIEVVVTDVLPAGNLFQNQKPDFVAGVEKMPRLRIM